MTEGTLLDDFVVQPGKSRLLITLVLDTSGSMTSGGRIGALNDALRTFRNDLLKDDYIAKVAEVAIVAFGGTEPTVIDASGGGANPPDEPYVPLSRFRPPQLKADGYTPMVEALQKAFELIARRRERLQAQGIPMANRPLVYLITDGGPTDKNGMLSDEWRSLAPVIRGHEAGKHLLLFALGVEGADTDVLAGLAPESHFDLAGMSFTRILRLVSTSVERLAASNAGNEDASTAYRAVHEDVDKQQRMLRFLQENG